MPSNTLEEQGTEERIAAAWQDYAETCRKAERYEDAEPWAWKRLQDELRALRGRAA